MDIETITKLLEQIETNQYKAVIRHFEQGHKRFKIPGFSTMAKAPKKLIANTAKTNKKFCMALLESISAIILSESSLDLDESVDEIKSKIPKEKWLGAAASLLLTDTAENTEKALAMIDCQTKDETIVVDIPTSKEEPKTDKKEERFREKYLKTKAKLTEVMEELKQCKLQLHETLGELEQKKTRVDKLVFELEQSHLQTDAFSSEIARLRNLSKEYENQSLSYLAQLDVANRELATLRTELEKANEKAVAAVKLPQPKLDVRILAPNCGDILCKYTDKMSIDFCVATNESAVEALEKYDEVWALPDILPHRTSRMLQKWKRADNNKVRVFQTVTELVEYVDKLMPNA